MDIGAVALAALWVVVVVQGIALIVLTRTVGSLMLLGRDAIERDGLKIGTRAPEFQAPDTTGATGRLSDYGGRWVVLVFAGPTCQICHDMLPGLAELGRALAGHAECLLLVRSTVEVALALSVTGPIRVLAIGDAGVVDAYKVRVSPYVQVVDPDGVIRAKGLVNEADHIEHLLREAGFAHPITARHAGRLTASEARS